MAHSAIVGGSTAKRVINCTGSVALCAKMPPKPPNAYTKEGSMLHTAAERVLEGVKAESLIGREINGVTLTQELYDEKLLPSLQAFNLVYPNDEFDYMTEAEVGFGDFMPGVFGSADVVGKCGDTAIILDWKFGSGVMVSAEENEQLMFYAAGARRTPATAWAFEGVTAVDLFIIQNGEISQWTTTLARIEQFEAELARAVKEAQSQSAILNVGGHCRWCAAKPICPKMTGAADRALKMQIDSLDKEQINAYLKQADLLEDWIKDLRALAFDMLEKGAKLPDWKLVQKRGIRKWIDQTQAKRALLLSGLEESEVTATEMLSPAAVEKVLKKRKIDMPEGLIEAVSSGVTLASVDDPRPEVLQIGQQLTAALSKLV